MGHFCEADPLILTCKFWFNWIFPCSHVIRQGKTLFFICLFQPSLLSVFLPSLRSFINFYCKLWQPFHLSLHESFSMSLIFHITIFCNSSKATTSIWKSITVFTVRTLDYLGHRYLSIFEWIIIPSLCPKILLGFFPPPVSSDSLVSLLNW